MKVMLKTSLLALTYVGLAQSVKLGDGPYNQGLANPKELMSAALAPEQPGSAGSGAVSLPPSGVLMGSKAYNRRAVPSGIATVPMPPTSDLPTGTRPFVSGQQHKPKVEEVFRQHLFKFTPNPVAKSCDKINEQLHQSEATSHAHISLSVILGHLDVDMFTAPEQIVSRDKNVALALQSLSTEMINDAGEETGSDLVNFMEPLIQCKVQPLEENRTILMKMVVMGLEKSLKTPFAYQLMKGTLGFEPSMHVDALGNTFMHLAVMSGAYNMPKVLFGLEEKKNNSRPMRRMNAIYWALSSLMTQNNAGFRPLDLASSTSMRDQLKGFFRTYALFLTIQGKKFGLTPDKLNDVNELLKTSSNVVPIMNASVSATATPQAAFAARPTFSQSPAVTTDVGGEA